MFGHQFSTKSGSLVFFSLIKTRTQMRFILLHFRYQEEICDTGFGMCVDWYMPVVQVTNVQLDLLLKANRE